MVMIGNSQLGRISLTGMERKIYRGAMISKIIRNVMLNVRLEVQVPVTF